jgi:hypothetical protein
LRATAQPQPGAETIAALKETARRCARHEGLNDVTKTLSDWNVAYRIRADDWNDVRRRVLGPDRRPRLGVGTAAARSQAERP